MSRSWSATRKLLDRFCNGSTGNVAVIFALLSVPLAASVGTAVDYGHASAIKASMQAVSDATALKLVKNAATLSSTQVTQQANDNFKALFTRPDTNALQISAQYSSQDSSVTVSATGSMKTAIIRIIGFSNLKISATAVAKSYGASACVLALNANASGSISIGGNTSISLKNCSMYDNSSSTTALTLGGSATLSALYVGVVGGISSKNSITATQGVATGLSRISDPYSKVSVPFFSGCNANNFSAKAPITIDPGVYCGGMQLSAGAIVTLNPGIYFIDRGQFSMNGGATITGTGVTLIFTSSTMSNWPTATISGGATVNLTPPTTGPTAGIVMFGDPNSPAGTSFKLTGGTSQNLGGAVYFPTGALTYAGGNGTTSTCTQLIADTISFGGASNLAIDCSSYGTKPVGPGGVRLAS